MPARLLIGPFRVRIVCDDVEMDRSRVRHGGDKDTIGRWDEANSTIYVDPNMSVDMKAETLLHEVLHAIRSVTGMPSEGLTEEMAIEHLSPMLIDTLRRNPELVAYLLEPH